MLIEMLEKYKNGEISYNEFKVLAFQYDQLYEHAKFLCSLGTPIRSSKDFQRAQKKVTDALAYSLAALEVSNKKPSEYPVVIPEMYDRKEAQEISKKVAIRYPWLSGDL